MKKISAKEFEAKFDAREDISEFADRSKMRRPGRETRCGNVLGRVVEARDREAERLGVTRQALVKVWIAKRLDGAA